MSEIVERLIAARDRIKLLTHYGDIITRLDRVGITALSDEDRTLFTPGADLSVAKGCTCPVMDNGRGVGFLIDGERQFWISGDCPLHGSPAIPHEET